MKSISSSVDLSAVLVLTAAMLFSATAATAVTIETVPVGNPGNAGELSGEGAGGIGPDAIVGGVPYKYRIGKYEVTNAQYTEFLNAVNRMVVINQGLYTGLMSSDARGGINFNGGAADGSKYEIKPGFDNKPVVFVSWYNAIRFANWLHNGQGSGDTETGAYTLLGRPSANSITRNPGAKWFLPSEDEWYKAAYHRNDGVTGNYWDYPTGSDNAPTAAMPPGSATSGNFSGAVGDGRARSLLARLNGILSVNSGSVGTTPANFFGILSRFCVRSRRGMVLKLVGGRMTGDTALGAATYAVWSLFG